MSGNIQDALYILNRVDCRSLRKRVCQQTSTSKATQFWLRLTILPDVQKRAPDTKRGVVHLGSEEVPVEVGLVVHVHGWGCRFGLLSLAGHRSEHVRALSPNLARFAVTIFNNNMIWSLNAVSLSVDLQSALFYGKCFHILISDLD